MKSLLIRLIDWLLVGYRPDSELRELNRLLVKAGRRAAYDLKHAADDLESAAHMLRHYDYDNDRKLEAHKGYRQRADMWLQIFNPADDGKHYRDRLHHAIDDLECKIEKYQKLLQEHGIEDTISSDDAPF